MMNGGKYASGRKLAELSLSLMGRIADFQRSRVQSTTLSAHKELVLTFPLLHLLPALACGAWLTVMAPSQWSRVGGVELILPSGTGFLCF